MIVREIEKLLEFLSLKVNDMYCEDYLEIEFFVLDEKGRSNLMEKVFFIEFYFRINFFLEFIEIDRIYFLCNLVGYELLLEDV